MSRRLAIERLFWHHTYEGWVRFHVKRGWIIIPPMGLPYPTSLFGH